VTNRNSTARIMEKNTTAQPLSLRLNALIISIYCKAPQSKKLKHISAILESIHAYQSVLDAPSSTQDKNLASQTKEQVDKLERCIGENSGASSSTATSEELSQSIDKLRAILKCLRDIHSPLAQLFFSSAAGTNFCSLAVLTRFCQKTKPRKTRKTIATKSFT
jgi:hypothetical protein